MNYLIKVILLAFLFALLYASPVAAQSQQTQETRQKYEHHDCNDGRCNHLSVSETSNAYSFTLKFDKSLQNELSTILKEELGQGKEQGSLTLWNSFDGQSKIKSFEVMMSRRRVTIDLDKEGYAALKRVKRLAENIKDLL